jgi:YebC/PmpR family DNA-binding regulatory protein
MSGHSKWASIKHKKGAVDAKRGKIFTKIIKEITVAARTGGGDPGGNPRLRLAIEKAKGASMPKENIERGIKRGAGELEGTTYEESTYEGYGPGGVAVLIQTLTDNRNRTVSEIRHLFSRLGGNLAEAGSVAWMFKKCGYITVSKKNATEEKLMEVALEAGAEDIQDGGEEFEIPLTQAFFF